MTAIRYSLILALVFLPASPFATTFPVTKVGDTDGTCEQADCSLREAIKAANANLGADDVTVEAGNYLLTLGQLVISDDVTITGDGQATTIIDGNATDRVFDVRVSGPSVVVEISDVTIQNGYANYRGGGGIRNYEVLTLTDSTVSGNTASGYGGGIRNDFYLYLINSTVNGNHSDSNGGGVFNDGGPFEGAERYAAITNSTVSGNSAAGRYGGGIHNFGNLTLTNSTVNGNVVGGSYPDNGGRGGGIFHGASGIATLTNSTVSGNSTTIYGRGGGIDSLGDLILTDSTVSGNYAERGGGISNYRGDLSLTNSTVSNNSARVAAGGVISGDNYHEATMTLTNSTVSGNDAQYIGGIFNVGYLAVTDSTVSENTAQIGSGGIASSGEEADATITNSTVSGNTTVGGSGGGITSFFGATMTLINSTVSGNSSNLSGGGIAEINGIANLYLTNTIVADNLPDNCSPNNINSLGHNLTDDTSCGFTATGDLVVADAMLYPLGNFGGPTKTHHPMTGSPAIDAANNASCPATDQRGEARPFDGDDPPDGFADCDIGSVEYLPEPHHAATMVAGAALLGLLYRRRARGLQLR
jgi:CSLREA domain-containing protein